jgi:hypothetical protein
LLTKLQEAQSEIEKFKEDTIEYKNTLERRDSEITRLKLGNFYCDTHIFNLN